MDMWKSYLKHLKMQEDVDSWCPKERFRIDFESGDGYTSPVIDTKTDKIIAEVFNRNHIKSIFIYKSNT